MRLESRRSFNLWNEVHTTRTRRVNVRSADGAMYIKNIKDAPGIAAFVFSSGMKSDLDRKKREVCRSRLYDLANFWVTFDFQIYAQTFFEPMFKISLKSHQQCLKMAVRIFCTCNVSFLFFPQHLC